MSDGIAAPEPVSFCAFNPTLTTITALSLAIVKELFEVGTFNADSCPKNPTLSYI